MTLPDQRATEACLVCDAPTPTIIGTLKPGQAAFCLACAFAIDMDRQRVETESAAPDEDSTKEDQ